MTTRRPQRTHRTIRAHGQGRPGQRDGPLQPRQRLRPGGAPRRGRRCVRAVHRGQSRDVQGVPALRPGDDRGGLGGQGGRDPREGFEVSASKGDLMPRDAIADLLRSIGREPPRLDPEVDEAAERLRASGAFVCTRTGRPGSKLEGPPFRGPVGANGSPKTSPRRPGVTGSVRAPRSSTNCVSTSRAKRTRTPMTGTCRSSSESTSRCWRASKGRF